MEKNMDYDNHYKQVKDTFGKEPENILIQYSNQIRSKWPILDIGAGQGRNALYLAQKGFSVDAIDPSSVAIETIEKAATEQKLSVKTFIDDFFTFDPGAIKYGGILVFGLLQILTWRQIDDLLSKIYNWTEAGSLIFLTAFSILDASYNKYESIWPAIGKNSFSEDGENVRTYLEPDEILNLFGGYKPLHHWEGTGPEHHHGDGIMEKHARVEAVFLK